MCIIWGNKQSIVWDYLSRNDRHERNKKHAGICRSRNTRKKKTFMGSVGRLRHADFGILWPWSLIWPGPWVQCLTPDGLLKRFFKALVGDASEITKATDRLWNSNQVSLRTWRNAPIDPPTCWAETARDLSKSKTFSGGLSSIGRWKKV